MIDSDNSSTTDATDLATGHGFVRAQLPPIPSLGLPAMRLPSPSPSPLPLTAPATDVDGRTVGGHDEPAGAWTTPFPAPAEPAQLGYTYQVIPPPLLVTETPFTPAPDVQSAPLTAPEPVVPMVSAVPVLEEVPATVPVIPARTMIAATLLLTALVLAWASRMAFSAALLSMSALLLAELARAASLSRTHSSRPSSSTLLAVASIGAAGWSIKGAFAQFQEYAFVGGLFVLLAAIPTLIVFGVTWLLLRRRAERSPGDQALLAGTRWRVLALGAMIVTGVQAHRTFTAKPDAIVALAVSLFALWIVVSVLRGTDRAAAPAA